jgi:UDP-GlcNAc:undecaprenyl-phosphate GlcNAc-1-phosphate transferase
LRAFDYLITFLVAFGVSAGVLPFVIRLAHRFGAVDRPDARRVHRGEIPRLGGIGIALGFSIGVGAGLLVAGRAHAVMGEVHNQAWYGTAIGLGIIFVAGLLDDLYQFRPHTKFLLQVVAAGTAVSTGVTVEAVTLPFGSDLSLGVLGPVAALAWILLVTNALNLIDGLDGLAGGLTLIMAAPVAAVALTTDQFAVVVCATALAGSVMGFLRYNFAPARIFMGDAGSQFLGFALAVISLRGSQKGTTAIAIVVPLLAFGLPLLDLSMAILRRWGREHEEDRGSVPMRVLRRIGRADREHLHHNLLDLGLSPRKALLALYAIAGLFAVSAYLMVATNSLVMAIFTLMASLGGVAAIKLAFRAGGARRAEAEAALFDSSVPRV